MTFDGVMWLQLPEYFDSTLCLLALGCWQSIFTINLSFYITTLLYADLYPSLWGLFTDMIIKPEENVLARSDTISLNKNVPMGLVEKWFRLKPYLVAVETRTVSVIDIWLKGCLYDPARQIGPFD